MIVEILHRSINWYRCSISIATSILSAKPILSSPPSIWIFIYIKKMIPCRKECLRVNWKVELEREIRIRRKSQKGN